MTKEKNTTAEAEGPIEAKHALAEVFNRTGGIAGMVTWAKNHRAAFYALYAKLIPVHVAGQVTAKAEGEPAATVLGRILNNIIASREEEEADTTAVVIDVTPSTPPEPIVKKDEPLAAPTLTVVTGPNALQTQARERATAPSLPPSPTTKPNSTQLFIEWSSSGRMWWGPV